MARPLVIAHRGGADLWPENTLLAFANAIAAGADGAELDIHLSRDGVPVVFHDETLKAEIVRGADGRWIAPPGPALKDLTFAELQAFDVGRLKPGTPYAARHPRQEPRDGERIPSLADVIALAKAASRDFQLWIELKTDLLRPERGADPVALAEAAVDLVGAMDFSGRTVFVSFDWRALARAKVLAPGIAIFATTLPQSYFEPGEPPPEHGAPPPRVLAAMRAAVAAGAPWEGPVPRKDHPSLQHAVKALGAEGWFPFWPDLTPESADRACALGLKLAAWTPPVAETGRLMDVGLHAICSDDPVSLRHFVATKESNSSPSG